MTETEKLILAVETNGMGEANKQLNTLDAGAKTVVGSVDEVTKALDRAKVKIVDYAAEMRKVQQVQKQTFDAKIERFNAADTLGPGNIYGPGSDAGKAKAQSESDKSFAAEERKQKVYEAQIRAIQARSAEQQAADSKAKIDADELAAKEERRNALISQRTAIQEMQLEAVQATAAQEYTKAAALEREIKVRQISLKLQQDGVVSEEESFILAERQVSAQATILATKEAQRALDAQMVAEEAEKLTLQKAQAQQGRIYGRGGQVTNSLRNFGVDENMAKAIGIGTVAAFALDSVIDGIGKHLEQQRVTAVKQSQEYDHQEETWRKMASTANDMTDVLRLHESINAKIRELQEKGQEHSIVGGTTQTLIDGARMWAAALLGQENAQKTSFEQWEDQQAVVLKNYEMLAKAEARDADNRVKFFKDAGKGDTNEQISKLLAEQVRLTGTQGNQEKYSEKWVEIQHQIDNVGNAIEKAQKKQEAFINESAQLTEEFSKAQLGGEAKGDKGEEAQAKITAIQGVLDELIGHGVPDAAAAFAVAADMTDKERVAVEKLAIEWQKMSNVISAESRKRGEELDKNMEKLGQRFHKEQDALDNMKAEVGIVQAQAAGHEALSKRLELELDYERQIASFRKEGILDTQTQAAAQDLLNAKLQKMAAEQGRAAALQQAENDVDNAKNGRSKSKLINAEVTQARLKKFDELTTGDKALDPDRAQKLANDTGAALNKKLRKENHIIGGPAPNVTPDSGFDAAFGAGAKGGLTGSALDNPNAPDGLNTKDSWDKLFHGGDGAKGAADAKGGAASTAADTLKIAANTLSDTAKSLGAASSAVNAVNAELIKLDAGLQTIVNQVNNLTNTVAQIQADSY